jgi:hypothetical protein
MIIPINESSAEVIIRNAISNINMTITNKQENDDINEESNLEFLQNLINKKEKNSDSNCQENNSKNSDQIFKSNDDTFFLNKDEEVTLNRNSDSLLFSKNTAFNKGNHLKSSKVFLF